MQLNRHLLKLFYTCLLLSIATFASAGKDEFVTPLNPEEMTFKDVKNTYKLVDIKKAFKMHNRILVGNYRVAYSVARTALAVEEGGSETRSMGGGWESVTYYADQHLGATVRLDGVDTKALDAITEKAYKDLITRLESVGREVITMDDDQVSSSEEIQKKLELSELDSNGEYWTNIGVGGAREMTIVTWPDNTPLWFMMGDVLDAGGSFKAAFNALKQKNFGFIKAVGAELDAAVLDISVTIRFADAWSKRSKMLRKAQVGVIPGMKMTLSRVGITTVKKTPIGIFPGPAGTVQGFRKAAGFDLGEDFATYNLDITEEDGLSVKGKSMELVVTTTPENMEAAVLNGLYSLNAALAAMAVEYKAK